MELVEQLSRRALLAGLAAGAAALAAPGAARAEASEVVIGAPNSLTGGLAEGGINFIYGLTTAVDQINREGGVKALGGAKLKLIVADTTSENAPQTASITRRLIDQERAVMIAGCSASAMTLAGQVECEKSRIPLLTNSYADPIVQRGMKYTFKIMPQGGAIWNFAMDTIVDMYKAVKGAPPANCVIIQSNDAVGLVVQKQLPGEAQKLGLPVLQSFGYQMGLTDPTVVVAPILQQKPDLIFLGAFLNDLILIVNALRSLGVTTPIINGGTFNTDSAINGLGKNSEHLIGSCTSNWDLPVPGVAELIDLYRKLHPDKSPYPPNDNIMTGYILGMIMRDALERTAGTDGEKLRDTLANTEFTGLPVSAEGGKVRFGPDGLNIYNNSILAEWQDGRLRTIWPKRVQAAPPRV